MGIRIQLKKRRIAQRLQAGRLGVVKLKRRTDVCPICAKWKGQQMRLITKFLRECALCLGCKCDVLKQRWEKLDYEAALDDPACLRDMIGFLEEHAEQHDACPAMTEIGVCMKDLQECLEKVEEQAFHHGVAQDIQNLVTDLKQDWAQQPDCTMLLHDFKAI